FQHGRRELARRTWQGLMQAVHPPAAAHARLAELLGGHGVLDDAVEEARAAGKVAARDPPHPVTLARPLGERPDPAGAAAGWRAALEKAADAAHGAERREARGRLVALLARQGRERLRSETVTLKDRLRRHPDDREATLYLAELQLSLQEPAAAVDTLSA